MANDFSDAVAAWLFASGALIVDSIGTNTLTAYGSIGSGTAIQGAPSVAFNGSSKYLGVADADLAAGFPFKDGDTGKLITVCCKLRLVTTSEVPMVGKLSFGTAQSFGFTWSSNPFFERDGSYVNNLGLLTFVNGHEYQIIYTIDGAGKKFSIYVHDYATGGYYLVNLTTSNAWTGSTLAFLIGRDATRNYAYGEIGEVVVFNRILSFPEMNDIKDGNYSSSSKTLIDFAPHDLTSYTSHSPFVVSGSANYSTLFPWRVFDNGISLTTRFLGNTGGAVWLKLDIGSENTKKLESYCVQTSSSEPTRAPKDWTMEGSNDDSTWDTLDTVTNQISWGSGETRNYVCDACTTAYRYFRLNITANNGDGGYTQVAELYLYASLFYLYNFTTTIAAVSAVSTPIAAITRPLASSPAAVSVVSSPVLAITRALQASVAAGSVTSDILLLNTLITAILAQSQVSSPVLNVAGPLNTAIAAQTYVPNITLKVLRNLAIAISGQSAVSTPAIDLLDFLTTAVQIVTGTSGAVEVLRPLATVIAAQAALPDDVYLNSHAYRDLITAIAAQTHITDFDLMMAFHESLMAKAKRYFGSPVSADLKAAAKSWAVTEENKEQNLPGDQYNDRL